MKQVNYTEYGQSNVLKITETPQPKIKRKKSVLVKVKYSSLNAIDWKNRKGNFRLVSGLLKPRTKQGFDFTGHIVDKSIDVNEFQINDKVIGLLGNFSGGALSEYIVVDTSQIVKVDSHLPEEQLAGLPMAGITAWLALLKVAKIKKGDEILINGGSSGVGHLAIQIAKAYGAKVTSVSSSSNLAFCTNLGADYVIDYTKEDFRKSNKKYNIIFDIVFNTSISEVKHLLKPGACYIGTTPAAMLKDFIFNRQAKFVAVKPDKEALADLVRLMDEKKLTVNIDKIFLMEDIIEAHNYIESSRTKGKLIVAI